MFRARKETGAKSQSGRSDCAESKEIGGSTYPFSLPRGTLEEDAGEGWRGRERCTRISARGQERESGVIAQAMATLPWKFSISDFNEQLRQGTLILEEKSKFKSTGSFFLILANMNMVVL